MITLLQDFLRERWHDLFPERPAPGELHFLVVRGSIGDDGGRVSFFVFDGSSPHPVAVVKTARDPKQPWSVTREFEALRSLRSLTSPAVASRIPRAIFQGNLGAYAIIIEEAVPGKAVNAIIFDRLVSGRKTAERFLDRITEWLAAFHREIQDRRGLTISDRKPLDDLLDRFTAVYGTGNEAAKIVDAARAGIPSLIEKRCPLVFEHGDFSPINVLFSGPDFFVIDWERSADRGLPLYDLFFLLTWYDFRLPKVFDGNYRLDHFAQTFFTGGEYASVATRAIERYGAVNGVDPSLFRTLFLMFLMKCAAGEYDLLTKQSDRGFMPIIAPGAKENRYHDGTLMKNNMYRLFLKHAAENIDRCIM